jgi:hypothetical protein
VPHGVASVTRDGVVDATGEKRAVDVIVMATGFEAQSHLARLRVVGRDGRTLQRTTRLRRPHGRRAVRHRPSSHSAGQVDAEGEHTVDELPRGVGEHGEVLEVELRLPHELLALRAGDRRERAFTHRVGAGPEAGEHRVHIEFVVGHAPNVAISRPADER